MRQSLLLILAMVMLAAHAQAASSARIELSTTDIVAIDGSTRVFFPDGVARLEDRARTEGYELRGATGRVSISTWGSTTAPFAPLFDPQVEVDEFDVENATLGFVFLPQGERFHLNVRTESGSSLSVEDSVSGVGMQTRLAQPYVAGGQPFYPLPPGGEYVDVSLQKGDAYVGNESAPNALIGFPMSLDASLRLAGEYTLHAHGGTVTFRDVEGNAREYRLGNWTEQPGLAGAPVRRETWRRLVFEGTVGDSTIATGEHWLAGGANVVWEVDGALVWSNATGRLTTSSGTTSFHDARVSGQGVATVAPSARAVIVAADAYAAEGEWKALVIDGEDYAQPPRMPNAAVGAASLGLLAILVVSLWALYTRLSRTDLLRHEKRRAIHDAVAASPGIHLRELHRRVGGAWGPFSFHVAMLERGGYLRVRVDGMYRAAYLAGIDAVRVGPRNPTARAILDALPASGGDVALPELRAALGLSRQLLDYHLRSLARTGEVLVDRAAGTARRAPDPASGRAEA